MATFVSRSHSLIARPHSVADETEVPAAASVQRDRPAASKAGMAWIWVRLIGVAFLFKTLEVAYDLILQLGMISNIFTVASVVGATPGNQTYRLWIGVVLLAAQIIVFGLFTYYLLRKGKAVHSLLMFERNGKNGS
jgi:hypothetical protein